MTIKSLPLIIISLLLPLSWVSAQNANTFLGKFTIISERNNTQKPELKPQTAKVNYAISDQKIALTFENNKNDAAKMTLIYDLKQQTITSFSENNNETNKKATLIPMPAEQIYTVGRATASANTVKIMPSEASKTIAGYNCKKYTIETEKQSIVFWATDKLHINLAQLMTYMGAKPEQYDLDKIAYFNGDLGAVLESEIVLKSVGDKLKLTIENLQTSVGHAIFDLSKYAIQDMRNTKLKSENK